MILLDIMMPVMDGFEVLSRLKAEKSWRDIPVVLISVMSDMDSVVKAIELGLGVPDPQSGALQYINAGHEPPLIVHRGQIKSKLMPTGPVVGVIEDTDFSVGDINL